MRREELELGVRGSVYGKEFCFGEDRKPYRCEIGYCCGATECCTYYYDLWWLWLSLSVIIMAGCCCAYRHRKLKLRHQQEQRQREISLMAYQGVVSSTSASEIWPSCKLPTYDEVTQEPPTPPPAYSEILGEPALGGDCPPFTGLSPAHLDFAWADQREQLVGAQESLSEETGERYATSDPLLPPGRHVDEGQCNGSERRRHITGDSGIELCEQEEETVCLAGRAKTQEDDREGSTQRNYQETCSKVEGTVISEKSRGVSNIKEEEGLCEQFNRL